MRAQKICKMCGLAKPHDDFRTRNCEPGGMSKRCKLCDRARDKAWLNSKSPEERAAWRLRKYENGGRASQRHRLYGVSDQEYDLLLKKQNGACAICEKRQKRALAVDHDHETGVVRGLLCTRCNTALGSFGDNAAGVKRALRYLRR